MITITENITSKLPGKSSLFVTFEYNPKIVEAIKFVPNAVYSKKTTTWEVPLTSLSELLDALCIYDDVELILLKEEIKNELPTIKLDINNFKSKPFNYQLEGILYGLQHDNFLLLDAPGLGKTLQSIYIAQERYNQKQVEHCLIICGVNTLKFNWKSEIEKHTNLSCTILGQRINKKGKLVVEGVSKRLLQLQSPIDEFFVITNIETLRNDKIVQEILSEKHNKFDMCIVDEIHKCKDQSSQQGSNFLKLNKFKYKIAMTGTLLLNSPLDCYVPLKWLGIERSTYTNFRYYFCNYGGPFNNIINGYKNLKVLKTELEENSIRRTKDILPELPKKMIIDELIEMNDEQSNFYDNIKDGIIEQVDKVELNTSNVLALLSRLRQATACPSILTTENIISSKIQRCCDLVEELCSDNNKVVIFSVYKETLNQLYHLLEPYKPLLCTGDVDDTIIDDNKKAFQTNDINKVMLCTISKMGTGHTLNRASNVIFIDTPYTNAEYVQCQDRCHRIGTTNTVLIYNLICHNTVDERVHEIVTDKEMLSDYIIDSKLSDNMINRLKSIILDLN